MTTRKRISAANREQVDVSKLLAIGALDQVSELLKKQRNAILLCQTDAQLERAFGALYGLLEGFETLVNAFGLRQAASDVEDRLDESN